MKFLSLILILLSFGCQDINGGALEIAWVIRGSDNRSYICDDPKLAPFAINKIKMVITGTEGEYQDVDICAAGVVKNCIFECDSTFGGSTFRGVTTFSIPPGTYNIGIQPLDDQLNPIPISTVETPSSLRKTIEPETITFMGVWQMVINLELIEIN